MSTTATRRSLSDLTDAEYFDLHDLIRSADRAYSDELLTASDEAGRILHDPEGVWDEAAYERTYGAVRSRAARLNIRMAKGAGRYNLYIGGIHVGWACRPDSLDRGWTVHASHHSGDCRGTLVTSGNKTRAEAIEEFLSAISIRGLHHYDY